MKQTSYFSGFDTIVVHYLYMSMGNTFPNCVIKNISEYVDWVFEVHVSRKECVETQHSTSHASPDAQHLYTQRALTTIP